MRMSERGVALLKKHEGLRLRAYDDLRPNHRLLIGDPVVGTITIGYGHIRSAEAAQEITAQEAEALLRQDLHRFEKGVLRLTEEYPDLKQHEFDALVSFAFNVGLGALEQSTLLRKLLVWPQWSKTQIADEFLRWVHSKGRRLEGLVQRRSDEREVFLGLGLSEPRPRAPNCPTRD